MIGASAAGIPSAAAENRGSINSRISRTHSVNGDLGQVVTEGNVEIQFPSDFRKIKIQPESIAEHLSQRRIDSHIHDSRLIHGAAPGLGQGLQLFSRAGEKKIRPLVLPDIRGQNHFPFGGIEILDKTLQPVLKDGEKATRRKSMAYSRRPVSADEKMIAKREAPEKEKPEKMAQAQNAGRVHFNPAVSSCSSSCRYSSHRSQTVSRRTV